MTDDIDILLIEDSASDAEMTIRALTKNKFANKLLHLKDGAAAFDYFFGEGLYSGRDIKKFPNLVLLDLKMPKIGGIDVLKRIKLDEFLKIIPVVILTSSKEDLDIQACYKLGANGYVVKPVEFEAFHKVVADLGLYWMTANQPPR